MEQTNLVVTPYGDTWDEVTRNTSYIGKEVLHSDYVGSALAAGYKVLFDDHRGGSSAEDDYHNKDFAIAYDRFICLVSGNYSITAPTMARTSGGDNIHSSIYINGTGRVAGYTGTSGQSTTTPKLVCDLVRGDYVQLAGAFRGVAKTSGFFIERN